MPVPSLPFTISIRSTVDLLEARVEGSLDALGGALLRTTLERVVVEAHHPVTLDLADVDRMDVAGARAVGFLAARVRSAGFELTVRSASQQVRDLLHAGALDTSVIFDDGLAIDVQGLTPDVLIAQAAARVNPFAVADAALRLVTTLAQATVTGADGVSVSLRRGGTFVTVAASDDRIAQMDRDQYATGQGPCLSAATSGEPVSVEVLSGETRWPDFVPRAEMGGIASILSSPLLSPDGPVGALNMYCRKEHGFGVRERALATLFAEQASSILVEASDPAASPADQARLQEALHTRRTIALAQGIVMARTGDSAERAYARLKLDARSSERSVHEVSKATVASVADDDVDSSPDE